MKAIGKEWRASSAGVMRTLAPRFTLTGSIEERTRIGLANEVDVSLEFDGWRKDRPPFEVRTGDPFHLYR